MSSKFLQVFLLLLFLSACKNEPKENPAFLKFEYTSVMKKSGEGCLTDDFNCTIISLDIPIAKGPEEIAEKINESVKDHVFSLAYSEEPSMAINYEEFAKDFISNQQAVAAEFKEVAPWKAIVSGRLLRKNQQLISMAIDSEIFTGGAHGYSSTSFFNFNATTGEKFEHKDLFEKEFTAYAEKAFRERYDIPMAEPINSTGFWFEGEEFHLPINIGITPKKVILLYNSYEIASYAEGDFRLEFPLEDIGPYLKQDLQ